ncbi:hypothetical protein ACGF12_35895 [Kitasatospora sp. NPDC048296]|uniref:hypothetical protein n=1 Tax=Kitasatospora sp. NPDC048296 TaxID=3364048 RepID=UPI0037193188
MNVDEAFAAAAEAYFRPALIPVEVTGETDPLRQVSALLAAVGGDTPAGLKAAAAQIGAPVDTVRRWVRGQRGIAKGSRAKVSKAYAEHILKPKQQRAQTRADNKARRDAAERKDHIENAQLLVTATIRWSKSPKKKYNRQAYRTTLLDNIDLSKAVELWARGKPAGRAVERAAAEQYGVTTEGGIAFEGNSVEMKINP